MLLPATVLSLVVLSMFPDSWLRWVQPFANLSTALLTPGSAVVSMGARWLMPERRDPAQSETERVLREESEHWRTLYLRGEAVNERLRRQIEDLQRGLSFHADLPVRQLLVPVVGASSDLASGLLRVRAGESLGVTPGTVAITSGLQIVGRVSSVSGPTSLILPFSRKAAGRVGGRVMVDEPNNVGVRCLLEPLGDGRFRGQLEAVTATADSPAPPPPEVGNTVRLDDDRWPASAQMFIIGRVESVETDPSSPLRTSVIVLPNVNIERVSEVTLRLVGDLPATPGGSR